MRDGPPTGHFFGDTTGTEELRFSPGRPSALGDPQADPSEGGSRSGRELGWARLCPSVTWGKQFTSRNVASPGAWVRSGAASETRALEKASTAGRSWRWPCPRNFESSTLEQEGANQWASVFGGVKSSVIFYFSRQNDHIPPIFA